jgi:hypothetical protein
MALKIKPVGVVADGRWQPWLGLSRPRGDPKEWKSGVRVKK